LKNFALAEKYNAVWLWAGDPAAADANRILDIPEYGKPGWGLVDGQYLHFATSYLNLTDNLVDPAHTSYVHKRTIGNSGGEDVPVKVEHSEGHIVAYRWVTNAEPVPVMKTYGSFKGNIDRWQYYHLYLPSNSYVDFGAVDTGGELTEKAKEGGFRSFTYNFLTPETAASTHYFWLHLRNYGVGIAQVDVDIARVYTQTFEEDRDLLAAIQQQQEATGVREYVKLSIDRAPARDGLAHLVVLPVRLDDLPADCVERVQRRQRILEDHRHLVAAQRPHVAFGHADEFLAFEPDPAGDLR